MMEPRIITHASKKIDRQGRPSEMSPAKIRHYVALNTGEYYSVETSLAPTITEWYDAMRGLRNKCEKGLHLKRRVF